MTKSERLLQLKRKARRMARRRHHVLSSWWKVHANGVRTNFCVNCWYSILVDRPSRTIWGNAQQFVCPNWTHRRMLRQLRKMGVYQ